jgi:CubicO group peptidase (beta-lactamase class C family)
MRREGSRAGIALGVIPVVVSLSCGGSSAAAPSARSQLTPVVSTAEWPASAPDAQGVNAQAILDLVGRIGRGEYGSVSSLLLARHGQLIVEEYFGWSASRAHTVQSVTKSVTSLLAGMAIDRGRLSIGDRAVDFFPGYQPIANLDDRKRAMTVRDLLTMQTGLEWNESVYNASPLQRLNDCQCDWLRFVLDWPMRETPGTRWEYVSGGVILLGGIVGVATGERMDQFAAEQLFGPLGIENAWWYSGLPNGLPHSGGGLNLRPRDMAKLGQLVLDGGRWRGAQIVPESWIRESTQVRLSNVRSFGAYPADYGYLWWTLPRGIVTASGAQGQWIFVVPSLDLVVTITGESDANFLSGPDLLYRQVLPAIAGA